MRATQGQLAESNTRKHSTSQKPRMEHVRLSKAAVLRKQYNAEKSWWRRGIIGYILCIPLVVAAMSGTLLMKMWLPQVHFPGSLLIVAILITALIWGVGPSLLALLLSTLLLDYFFIQPVGQISAYQLNDAVQLLPFILSGLVIALITAQRERARLTTLAAEQELQEYTENLEQTNKRLEETNQQLKETNQMKDRFISIASHELKTPITTIRGQAQLVLRRLSKQQELSHDIQTMRTTLEKINDQTSRLTSLVDDLLDMSSLRTGKAELRKRECDIVDICRGVIDDQRLLSGRTITLTVETTPLKLLVDCDRIAQVLVNLVGNAIKYSPEGKPVAVNVRTVDGKVQVQVRDAGKGIAKDQQHRIFETFYRTPDAQSSTKSGLGLGLAISKEIVERHNGSIWCESEPGKGSTFYVELPVK